MRTTFFNKSVYERLDLQCKFCGLKKNTTKSAMTSHEKHCEKNPNRIEWKGHTPSKEVREKISKGMKKAIEEGRATGWHTRKTGTKSYPEQWFENVIKNEFTDKNYTSEFHLGKYRLDFAWEAKKRYIEIDGSQHREEKRKLSDIQKDKFCENLGWEVLRLDWEYIFNNTQEAIKKAKEFIEK